MNKTMGNVPNLKSSKSVDQQELQNAKQEMGSLGAGQGMTSGMARGGTTSASGASLSSSTAVDQQELQKVREKVQKGGFQNSNNSNMS